MITQTQNQPETRETETWIVVDTGTVINPPHGRVRVRIDWEARTMAIENPEAEPEPTPAAA